jgi:hypothetical protein
MPKQLVTAVLPDTVTRYLGEFCEEFKEKSDAANRKSRSLRRR